MAGRSNGAQMTALDSVTLRVAAMAAFDWRPFLETWSQELIEAGAYPELPVEVVESGWLGFPGATEEQLSLLEARLQVLRCEPVDLGG